MSSKKEKENRIKVTLIKSISGRLQHHQDCVKGLGLRKLRQTVELTKTPEVLGMIRKVSYLLAVEESA